MVTYFIAVYFFPIPRSYLSQSLSDHFLNLEMFFILFIWKYIRLESLCRRCKTFKESKEGIDFTSCLP